MTCAYATTRHVCFTHFEGVFYQISSSHRFLDAAFLCCWFLPLCTRHMWNVSSKKEKSGYSCLNTSVFTFLWFVTRKLLAEDESTNVFLITSSTLWCQRNAEMRLLSDKSFWLKITKWANRCKWNFLACGFATCCWQCVVLLKYHFFT